MAKGNRKPLTNAQIADLYTLAQNQRDLLLNLTELANGLIYCNDGVALDAISLVWYTKQDIAILSDIYTCTYNALLDVEKTLARHKVTQDDIMITMYAW